MRESFQSCHRFADWHLSLLTYKTHTVSKVDLEIQRHKRGERNILYRPQGSSCRQRPGISPLHQRFTVFAFLRSPSKCCCCQGQDAAQLNPRGGAQSECCVKLQRTNLQILPFRDIWFQCIKRIKIVVTLLRDFPSFFPRYEEITYG